MAGFRLPLAPQTTRRVVAGVAVLLTLQAVFMSLLALMDADTAWRGEAVSARVVEVGEERRSRGLRVVEVKLEVARADGSALVDWAARPHRVTGGWSDPARPPRPGERMAAWLLPDAPPRLVPASAVHGAWSWAGTLGFSWLLAAGGWLAFATLRRQAAGHAAEPSC